MRQEALFALLARQRPRKGRAKGFLVRKGYCVKVIQTTPEELRELLMPFTKGPSHKMEAPYVCQVKGGFLLSQQVLC